MKAAVPASSYQFKLADCEAEYESVHRLNHRTFAEEIPQHDPHADGLLVDRFHGQNRYLIALRGEELAGMVCLRFDRPFSLDQKIPDDMAKLPADRSWCEIRLLALERRHRGTVLLTGLLRELIREVVARGRDAAVISATTRQLKLYTHMGFTPFGPLVGREGAWYQPMWSTVERLRQAVPQLAGTDSAEPVNLMPGPVAIPDYVRAAFARPAVSHRGAEVVSQVQEIRTALTRLTGAAHAALLPGGGTLANDAVAARLRLSGGPGVIINGGEFGYRLTDHARRAGLKFTTLKLPRGAAAVVGEIADFLDNHPGTTWLWLTHCETSTGVLHPLEEIAEMCQEREIKLCVDCVSSLGVVPVNLGGVYLASAASGKGLAAYPGVAIVFHSHPVEPEPDRVARYLDLGLYAAGSGIPFTLGSNLISALHAALTGTDWFAKIGRVRLLGTRLRRQLTAAGLPVAGVASGSSPAVMTLKLPGHVPCSEFADRVERAGYRLGANSSYLLERNEVQVCLMGDLRPRHTKGLSSLLAETLRVFPAG